jgi:hypothetical protein
MGEVMADTRRACPPADAWRVPLEGHVRLCVDFWVRALPDDQLRVAGANILEILDVASLLLNPEPAGAAAEGEQEKAS